MFQIILKDSNETNQLRVVAAYNREVYVKMMRTNSLLYYMHYLTIYDPC